MKATKVAKVEVSGSRSCHKRYTGPKREDEDNCINGQKKKMERISRPTKCVKKTRSPLRINRQ